MKPRATLHKGDGSTEDVSDKLDRAEEFFGSLEQNVDTPNQFRLQGWQRVDDAHPAGLGRPGYRTVFKTLRCIPYPSVEIEFENLRIRFANGDVERGGARSLNSIPTRAPLHEIVPEHGRLVDREGHVHYMNGPDMLLSMGGWEDTVQAVCFVEIICITGDVGDGSSAAILTAGRERVASIITMLDLEYGARLLAMPLTEEIGEVCNDWHWNRRLDSVKVSLESQAQVHHIDGQSFVDTIVPRLQDVAAMPEEAAHRLRLSSQWVLFAQAEPDRINRYAFWWLAIESLTMESTNIIHAWTELENVTGLGEAGCKSLVKRLYRWRNDILHGQKREVPEECLEDIAHVARGLLAARLLGRVPSSIQEGIAHAVAR